MSQICNFFTRNFITFQDLKTYNSAIVGMSVCGKKAVINSVVIPEGDSATVYFDNPKHNCQGFLCGYLQRRS